MPLALSAIQYAINHFRLVQKNRTLRGTMNGDQEDLEGGERATEVEKPIEECSWFFVGVSFLFTSLYSGLIICFGVNQWAYDTVFIDPVAGLP